MKKQKHSMKKRYIFCIAAIALLIISYFAFLCVYSRNYTMMIYLKGTTDLSTVRVECSSEDIVKVTDIRIGSILGKRNTLEVGLESISHGKTDVTVFYDDIYDSEDPDETVKPKSEKESFRVSYIGTIWSFSNNAYNGIWTIRLLMIAIMIVLVITFSLTFREKQKNGDFTYSMVTLGGLIFFMLATVVLSVYDIVSFWDYMPFMNTKYILLSVSTVSNHFIEITLIPLVLFCLVLSISNIRLVRHEGFRVQNLLGFILGVFVAGGIAAMYFAGKYIYSGSLTQELLLSTINSAVSVTFCYMECLLVSTVFCALMSTKYKIKQPMDYIIILGCAIRKDGSPTPILRGRIDRALTFEKEQFEKWNRHAKFVPSGGQGSNEVISEAESMKRYLTEQGVPEESILKEDKSVNTYQNMHFQKRSLKLTQVNSARPALLFPQRIIMSFAVIPLRKGLE